MQGLEENDIVKRRPFMLARTAIYTALFLAVTFEIVLSIAVAPKCHPSQSVQWMRGALVGQSCVSY